jgi:hypothetical protein
MNISPLTMYFVTRIDHFIHFLEKCCILSSLVIIIFLLGLLVKSTIIDNTFEIFKDNWDHAIVKLSFFIYLSCSIIGIFIPTQKEIAAIILIPAIVNNEKINNIKDSSLDLINQSLIEWIDDMKKDGVNDIKNAVKREVNK